MSSLNSIIKRKNLFILHHTSTGIYPKQPRLTTKNTTTHAHCTNNEHLPLVWKPISFQQANTSAQRELSPKGRLTLLHKANMLAVTQNSSIHKSQCCCIRIPSSHAMIGLSLDLLLSKQCTRSLCLYARIVSIVGRMGHRKRNTDLQP